MRGGLVSQFHNQVNGAVGALWGHAATETVELPPSLSFCRDDTKYPDFQVKYQALTQDCGYPVPSLLQNLKKSVPQNFSEQLEGTTTLEEDLELLDIKYVSPKIQVKGIK